MDPRFIKLPRPSIRAVTPAARGFTLVEVLISIAIALLLIVGISQIFAIAQRTTSAGTALLGMNGSQRSIQTVLNEDFRDIVTDSTYSPGLAIVSNAAVAYYDKADSDSDRDGDPQSQNDPSSSTGSLPTTPTANDRRLALSQPFSPNSRIHRLDRLGFFASNIFHRQTADAPNFMSQTSSSDAFIWYGHLALLNNHGIGTWDPDNSGTVQNGTPDQWFNPGAAAPLQPQVGAINDNNLYASQWILGREVILLLTRGAEDGYSVANSGSFPLSLLPNVTSSIGNAKPVPICASRYDLSYTTMNYCRQAFGSAIPAAGTVWWENLMGVDLGSPVQVSNPLPGNPLQIPGTKPDVAINTDQRYYANPYPTKPANVDPYRSDPTYRAHWHSSASAQTAPIFVRGCTQFIVEFAGNYVTQDQDSSGNNPNFGKVTALTPDPTGKIDFISVKDSTSNWTRQIRWYGFPRDVNGSDPKTGATILGQPDGIIDPNDVMPLGVFMTYEANLNGLGTPPIVSFERAAPVVHVNDTTMKFNPATYNLAQSSNAYACVWGPDYVPWTSSSLVCNSLPKMIRITIATGDANGRLNTDRSYEYVFTLP